MAVQNQLGSSVRSAIQDVGSIIQSTPRIQVYRPSKFNNNPNMVNSNLFGLTSNAGLAANQASQANQDKPPYNINTPGLVSTREGNVISLNRSPELQALLQNITTTGETTAQQYGNLLSQVEPGIGQLTTSQLATLENKRRQAIGNLRQNLARRRLAGSSFAADAEARANAEFAQQAAATKAQSFLTELQLKSNLIQDQATTLNQDYAAQLAQFNFESQLGAQLSENTTNAIMQAQQFQQSMAAKEAAGKGQFFGTIGGLAGYAWGGPLGSAAGGLLGGVLGGAL